jgi:hypothetical protein
MIPLNFHSNDPILRRSASLARALSLIRLALINVKNIQFVASYCMPVWRLPLRGFLWGATSTRFWTGGVFKNTEQMKRHMHLTRIPIDKKESIKWLENLEESHKLVSSNSLRAVHIGDRENDIYEYFCRCSELGSYFLIRACVNRLANEATISEEATQEKCYADDISFLNSSGKRIETTLEIKVKSVELHPPIGERASFPDLKVTIISGTETMVPKDRSKIRWNFITNLPVRSICDR